MEELNSCLAAQNARDMYGQYFSTDHFFWPVLFF